MDKEQLLSKKKEYLDKFDHLNLLVSLPETMADKRLYFHLLNQISALKPIADAFNNDDTDALFVLFSKQLALNDETAMVVLSGECEPSTTLLSKKIEAQLISLSINISDFIKKQGQKSLEISFSTTGEGAYSAIKGFNAVHILNSKKVSVLVFPFVKTVIDQSQEFDLNGGALRVDIFHSGGKGGQNVNKVETAVRITHLKSGIAQVCQDERSQLKNRARALSLLKQKVIKHYADLDEKANEQAKKQAKQALMQEKIITH
ncbi:MAG: hypothetical protein FWD86_00935 [Firmicutes bacterium]|nr:hypothetical protein [Bacillota bacterium]